MLDAHDHGDISSDPLQFQEAIDRFRQLVPMTEEQYDALTRAEQDFAFTVANVAQADLVAEVYEAIQAAIKDGEMIDDFKARVGDGLADEWGGDNPDRIDTIFRTNVMDAYGAGRYDVMTSPAVAAARPYWRYDGIGGDGRTCDICAPCLGVILPQDHRWWRHHYPLLHYRCRDVATPMTGDEARDEGITDDPPDVEPLPGFGSPPSGAGSDWEPDTDDYPAPIGQVLDDRLDADADAESVGG